MTLLLLVPGWNFTCFSDAVWFPRIEMVVCVVMSTILALWSPEAVAKNWSSGEKIMSIIALP